MQDFVFKILRFGLVGIGASLLYALIVYVLLTLELMTPVSASILAYLVAIPVSFIGQKYFTFQAEERVVIELPKFISVQLLGLCLSTLIMWLSTHYLADPRWGIILVILAIPAMSFTLMNVYVFVRSQDAERL